MRYGSEVKLRPISFATDENITNKNVTNKNITN
jgi:hypothetical protein